MVFKLSVQSSTQVECTFKAPGFSACLIFLSEGAVKTNLYKYFHTNRGI
jgi:hypothetical protein